MEPFASGLLTLKPRSLTHNHISLQRDPDLDVIFFALRFLLEECFSLLDQLIAVSAFIMLMDLVDQQRF